MIKMSVYIDGVKVGTISGIDIFSMFIPVLMTIMVMMVLISLIKAIRGK
jgi:hypothetical protein